MQAAGIKSQTVSRLVVQTLGCWLIFKNEIGIGIKIKFLQPYILTACSPTGSRPFTVKLRRYILPCILPVR
jgi:hypothetical protein